MIKSRRDSQLQCRFFFFLLRNGFHLLFCSPLKLNLHVSSESSWNKVGIISEEETYKTAFLIGLGTTRMKTLEPSELKFSV